MKNPTSFPTLFVLALTLLAGPSEALQQLVIVQEVMQDRNAPASRRNEFLDTTFFASGRRTHASVTFGNFAAGVELGGYLLDGRGSSYGISLRRRQEGAVADAALQLETGQILGGGLVAYGSIRMVRPDEPEQDAYLWVPSIGADYYHGGYSFSSFRTAYDPRPDTGVLFRVANRWGWENGYLELALAPRTDGIVNYSMSVQYGYLIAGYARERDFDFTRLDRQVAYLGIRCDLRP